MRIARLVLHRLVLVGGALFAGKLATLSRRPAPSLSTVRNSQLTPTSTRLTYKQAHAARNQAEKTSENQWRNLNSHPQVSNVLFSTRYLSSTVFQETRMEQSHCSQLLIYFFNYYQKFKFHENFQRNPKNQRYLVSVGYCAA